MIGGFAGIGEMPYCGGGKALPGGMGPLRLEDEPTENSRMQNPFFQLGAAFAGLVLFAFMALEGRDVAQAVGLVEEDEPVLIFSIPNPEHLAGVRAAIAEDRILHDNEEGFAVSGGRVYVRDVAQAGDLIEESGWVDQPIQIVSLGMDGPEDESAPTPSLSREERLARVRSLVNKPTLTRGEQLFVLQAMNDGIEI